jgi:hypothetical protein
MIMTRSGRLLLILPLMYMWMSIRVCADGWEAIGPPNRTILSFAFSEDRSVLYATTDSGLMMLTRSEGWRYVRKNHCLEWPIGNECISYVKIYRHPMRSDLWFVGWNDVWFESQTFVSRMSLPEGTWEEAGGFSKSLSPFNIGFNSFNPAVVYGNLESYARSDDTGKTWSYPGGQSAFRSARFLAPDIRRQATLYTIGFPNNNSSYGIYKTTDNGSHWNLAYRDSFGFELGYPSAVVTGDTVVVAVSSTTLPSESGVLYSADGGASWHKVLRGVNVTALGRDMARTKYIYAGTPEGLYLSGNGGFSWERWNTTIPRYPIVQIEPDPRSDTVYVATTGGGMYRVFDYSTSISDPRSELPERAGLLPVYPNPFNPFAVVEISLPKGAEVFVEALNILGQRVSVIAEGRMEAGRHAFRFDGSLLPSGMYFLRARLGPDQFVRSALLVR